MAHHLVLQRSFHNQFLSVLNFTHFNFLTLFNTIKFGQSGMVISRVFSRMWLLKTKREFILSCFVGEHFPLELPVEWRAWTSPSFFYLRYLKKAADFFNEEGKSLRSEKEGTKYFLICERCSIRNYWNHYLKE